MAETRNRWDCLLKAGMPGHKLKQPSKHLLPGKTPIFKPKKTNKEWDSNPRPVTETWISLRKLYKKWSSAHRWNGNGVGVAAGRRACRG
jgi:hypothetical protein